MKKLRNLRNYYVAAFFIVNKVTILNAIKFRTFVPSALVPLYRSDLVGNPSVLDDNIRRGQARGIKDIIFVKERFTELLQITPQPFAASKTK